MAYNWIGPRGPIPNIEIPNILNLSHASIGGGLTSERVWIEGIWNDFRQHFDLAPTAALKNDDIFIYPLTLYWRVNFEYYFSQGDGILEYAHIDHEVINKIQNYNGYILIDHSPEAFVTAKHLRVMHSYFSHYNIPLNKILYLTGCMNVDEVYENFCRQNNIPNDPKQRIKLISFPCAFQSAAGDIANHVKVEYEADLFPKKIFLSWNRRHKLHRNMLALMFDKHNLLDKSYFSMTRSEPEYTYKTFESNVDLEWLAECNLTVDDLNNFVKKLPLIVDGEVDTIKMTQTPHNNVKNFYRDSLISLVTETNFEEPEISMTEKSIKPIKEKHPFIMLGVCGTLKQYHKLGYKTFNEFWSEEYDNIPNTWDRLKEIIRICIEISQWDQDEILDFKHRVKPIIEHNYRIASLGISEIVFSNIKQHIES